MRQIVDILGKKFGRLKVLKRDGTDNDGRATWFCICKCGKNTVVSGKSLRKGRTQSCGCLNKENHLKHGHACKKRCSNEYKTWQGMIGRCYCSGNTSFVYYGGRGIEVCNRWRGANGFKNFYADMGARPSFSHSLDRIDNNKGYYKDNCRWAIRSVQQLNRRRSSNNTSGVTGVHYVKNCKKFVSRISINGRRISLGYFEKFDDAMNKRKVAEEKYYTPILEQAK